VGLEAECKAEWAAQAGDGRAQLETDAFRFRGAFSLSIPLRDVKKAVARNGTLTITFGRDKAVFHLGAQAERWADKILHPPGVLEKLGLKPGMNVGVVGPADDALLESMRARTSRLQVGRPRAGSEMIFLFAAAAGDLSRLKALRDKITPDGSIWAIWPKGRPELKEDHVRAVARGVGLVDVKVCSVSERLSGLKLMIPRAQR
jgi:hypothetical protein